MPERQIGSIWTVPAVGNSLVVVLAGPFAAMPSRPEYVVAPLYRGNEQGFRQTDEDVELRPEETGLPETVYAAIWNARPGLSEDLELPRGLLPDEAIAETRDIYWASINEAPIRSERLGKPVRSGRERVVAFQFAELERWQAVSSRVLIAPVAQSFVGTFSNARVTLGGLGAGGIAFSPEQIRAFLVADPSTIADAALATVAAGQVLVNSVPLGVSVHGATAMITVTVHGATTRAPVADSAAPDVALAANADYALAA